MLRRCSGKAQRNSATASVMVAVAARGSHHGTVCSVQSSLGRVTCRRKTATSYRSTKISAFLAASLRASSTSRRAPEYEQVDKTDEH